MEDPPGDPADRSVSSVTDIGKTVSTVQELKIRQSNSPARVYVHVTREIDSRRAFRLALSKVSP